MTDVEMANSVPEAAPSKSDRLPITVAKPTPYTFDLGNLVANDPNPLTHTPSSQLNDTLKTTARDGTQSLINQLLTTCPINSTQQNGVLLTLPQPTIQTPRHKPLPTPKPPTKWELFAKKKGIGKYSRDPTVRMGDKERRKNVVFDEASKEWVPKWGYKGKNKGDQDEALVEVPEKEWKKEEEANANARAGGSGGRSVRGLSRAERKEKIKLNEKQMRANERRARRSGA